MNVPATGTFATVASIVAPKGLWLLSAKARVKDQNRFVESKLEIAEAIGEPQILESYRGPASGNTGLYFIDVRPTSFDPTTILLTYRASATGASLTHVRMTLFGGETSLRYSNMDPD